MGGHELRQGIVGGGEYGRLLVQAGEPQEMHELRLGREQAITAIGPPLPGDEVLPELPITTLGLICRARG